MSAPIPAQPKESAKRISPMEAEDKNATLIKIEINGKLVEVSLPQGPHDKRDRILTPIGIFRVCREEKYYLELGFTLRDHQWTHPCCKTLAKAVHNLTFDGAHWVDPTTGSIVTKSPSPKKPSIDEFFGPSESELKSPPPSPAAKSTAKKPSSLEEFAKTLAERASSIAFPDDPLSDEPDEESKQLDKTPSGETLSHEERQAEFNRKYAPQATDSFIGD